ncbi:MAG: phosphate signaling complex protein PhoU [Elusimicrobiota bacterium]
MLKEKLIQLKHELVDYSALIERMIQKSIQGLEKRNENMLLEVIEKEEGEANKYEIEIDEMCAQVIAQFQPKARDLRTVLMILKINNDLERIGDLAVNISQSSLFLIKNPQLKPLEDIPKMTEITKRMLKDSINSFVNGDSNLAKNVCERDNLVDSLRDSVWKEIIKLLVSSKIDDEISIQKALYLMGVSRYLERIADLSTNICEDVIFMVEGKVIKHHLENNK